MAYDLLIKNAQICDGTGAPPSHGAVAVVGNSIAAVGNVSGSARREINADGLVLTPGFIDIHTHYDAQISWDPLLTSAKRANSMARGTRPTMLLLINLGDTVLGPSAKYTSLALSARAFLDDDRRG